MLSGGSGLPFLPHAATKTATSDTAPSLRRARVASQDVARQVVAPRNVLEHAIDVRAVHVDRAAVHLGRVEGYFVEQPLHHRVETPRADVLGALVDERRQLRDALDRVRRET